MDVRLNRIIEQLKKWESNEDAILQNGTMLICRIVHATPLNYLHRVYSPLNTLEIEKIETLLKIALPNNFIDFLLSCNGMDIFNDSVSIFGLRKNKYDGYFDTYFQPKDIIIENLGRYFQSDYFKFASYRDSYDLFFKYGEQDKVYVKSKQDGVTVLEIDSFYEWLNYSIELFSKHFNRIGKLVKDVELNQEMMKI